MAWTARGTRGIRPVAAVADMSYLEALEAAPVPHEVIVGPVPCATCRAWVEWAGVEWLAVGTSEAHECEPYLAARRPQAPYRRQRWPEDLGREVHPAMYRQQAWPLSAREAAGIDVLGRVIVALAAVGAAALAAGLVVRWALGLL